MLGSGTSSGVPRLGGPDGRGDWGSCDPAEPRNRRRRVSLLIEAADTVVLIDTGPDMREQLLDAGVSRLDAVLYTHDHADHAHGIDDLRQLFHNQHRAIDCYADPSTWTVLARRFDYVFEGRGGYPATCTAHDLPPVLSIGPLHIRHFQQPHGSIESLGFRIEGEGASVAYSTDIKDLRSDALSSLEHLDLWVVDALRRAPHPSHSHLDQTLGWIAHVRPRRAVLTHMDNTMDYRPLAAELPAGVEPGYDGLVIDLS